MKTGKRLLILFCLLCLLLPAAVSCGDADFKVRERLIWAVGAPLPAASEYLDGEYEGYTFRYADVGSFTKLGDYDIPLIAADSRGHETKLSAKLTLVSDEQPPVISGMHDLSVRVTSAGQAEGVAYLAGVTVKDNCDGKVTLTVDHSAVDFEKTGIYPVVYTATDIAGNVAVSRVTLTVYRDDGSLEKLNALLDPVISEIIRDGMSVKEKVRAVYDYVYDHVMYSGSSEKSNWITAAYEGIQSSEGDCFTYFALTKAFLERLGIPNMDVRRDEDLAARVGERHYWNLVNIGTESQPKWYHLDTTHLINPLTESNMGKPWGFLMTDAQLESFSRVRSNYRGDNNYFYVYNTAAYPQTETDEITPFGALD